MWPDYWLPPINLWNAPRWGMEDNMGQDNGMDASPSWQDLKDERDAYEDMAHGMSSDLTTVGEERDALAAHVERIKEARNQQYPTEDFKLDNWIRGVCAVVDESPNISLARLKAEWQAEALEDVAAEYRDRMEDPTLLCIIDASILERRANDLRRQASGDTHEAFYDRN